MVRTAIIAVLIALAAGAAHPAAEFSVTMSNAGLARTISNAANILKTSKLEANRVQMLDQPSVEFMIAIEHNGQSTILAPSDFRFHEASMLKRNQEQRRRVELRSVKDGFPLIIYVDYYLEPKTHYQQKAIVVRPSAAPEGAVIQRITIEDLSFRAEFEPFAPAPGVDYGSEVGAFNPKGNRGVFFFSDSPTGGIWFARRGILTAWEQPNIPLSEGWETARVTIGTASGSAEALYERYRDFAWQSVCAVQGKTSPDGDFLRRFEEFKKRFQQHFTQPRRAAALVDGSGFDCEAFIDDGTGFLVLFNPTRQAVKARIPLEDPGFGLTGGPRFYDWTGLESASPMDAQVQDGSATVDLAPLSVRIIGVNIEG